MLITDLSEESTVKICVLILYENSDSPMKDYDPLSDVARHLEGHECETVYIDKAKAYGKSSSFAARYDVFINLCDGAWMKIAPASKWCRRWNDWASPSPALPQASTNRRVRS